MADWTTDAVDTLERVVAVVRDKTVVPARRASKALVYGLLVGAFVSVALVLLGIAGFRVLVVLLDEVWAAYLVSGAVLVIAGALCWRRRNATPKGSDA